MTTMKKYQLAIAVLAVLVTAATTPTYAQTYSVVYSFGSPGNAGTAGTGPFDPMGAIAQGPDGNLYSTSYAGSTGPDGGTDFPGTVFDIDLTAQDIRGVSTWNAYHYFCSQANCADGSTPVSGLTLRPDGQFLGTTTQGGSTGICLGAAATIGCGTIFDVYRGGFTTLHTFAGQDGENPMSAPILGPDGNFYGVASSGGLTDLTNCGTIYRLIGAEFTLLYQFHEVVGCNPVGPLVLGSDGNLYGTTEHGGPESSALNRQIGQGMVFRATLNPGKSIQVTVLADFNGSTGIYPNDLIEGSDGNFYGTTLGDGETYFGSVFKITPTGTVTVLHTFNGQSDGLYPNGIVQASDGNFYGTASAGGTLGGGTLFEITAAGSFSVLHNFGGNCGLDCYDGSSPVTIPMQDTSGVLYGDTVSGGSGIGCEGTIGCGVFYSWDAGLPAFVSTIPSMGKVGSSVMILGQDSNGTNTVSFNGTPATSSGLNVTVPAGATSGFITVTNSSGGTLTSNKQFIVTP